MFYKRFAYNLPIFLIGKIWINIDIYQTMGFSIQKMSPLVSLKRAQKYAGLLANLIQYLAPNKECIRSATDPHSNGSRNRMQKAKNETET
jgi:hypothetical protein